MKKILALVLALVLCLGCFAACGGNDADTLTMATEATFPPYEYKDGDKIIGIDAEIAQAIADKLGMELEIINTEFGSIVGGVQSGKYDMGMAGMTVTDERKESVNFTDTYATGVQVVIVKEGGKVQSLDDLAGDIMIGVQQDTTGHIYASGKPEDGGYGEDKVLSYKSGGDAVQALISGKVDCVIIDNEPAKAYVAANSGLSILDTEYVTENYAICVSKDNDELLQKINDALNELIADGTVDAIINKYITAE